MAFACVHIPEFLVQAVIRNEPSFLRPLTREARGHALALLEGTPPQCRVVAANEAALRAGIQIGMSKAQAEQFGSIVQIRQRSLEQEKNAHAALLDLGASISPRVEDSAPEAILLDLAGLESLFGSDEAIAQRLWQGARHLGLEAHVAVASNPDTALHAARGVRSKGENHQGLKPKSACNANVAAKAATHKDGASPHSMEALFSVIPSGKEAAQIGPLPISVLGPSAEALETLHRWGIRTCAALAALPVLDLSERLGAEGVRLHEWALGAVQRSLVLAEAPVSFEEELTLDYEVTELEPLSFLLSRLIEALCVRLAARSLAVAKLRLRLKVSKQNEPETNEKDGKILRRLQRARSPQDDKSKGVNEPGWFTKVLSLPVPMRNAKLLLNLLRLQLQNDPPGAPVCGVFLAAEPARPRATQGGFFVPKGPDPEKLELTLARLAHLVGEARVGSPQILNTHRPDAFRMRRFAPATASGPKKNPQGPRQSPSRHPELQQPSRLDNPREIAGEKPQVAHNSGRPEQQKIIVTSELDDREKRLAGFRVFRPAIQARVEMREEKPVRVFFRARNGKFQGGEVVAASGPWRASGDWWNKDSWQQEEWDLEIVFAEDRKSRFLVRQQGCVAQPPSVVRILNRQKMADSNIARQSGLYRLAYDRARDLWLVQGMFD